MILGQYGVERWDARSGEITAPEPPPGIEPARRAGARAAGRARPGDAQVEDKGRALGLHVRRLPDPDAALERLREPVEALAAELDLHVEPGQHVFELRAQGVDKGHAIETLLAETGATTIVYAGDDVGDVAAFDAVERHRDGGGHGLLIWSESDESPAAAQSLGKRADLVLARPRRRDRLARGARRPARGLSRPAKHVPGSSRSRSTETAVRMVGPDRPWRPADRPRLAAAHPEGLRERPDDVPATRRRSWWSGANSGPR